MGYEDPEIGVPCRAMLMDESGNRHQGWQVTICGELVTLTDEPTDGVLALAKHCVLAGSSN